MAPADFPLPRAMLPTLTDRRDTRQAAKLTVQRLLEHTVCEFEQLSYTRNGAVDATQWKALSKTQAAQNGQHDDEVTVYRERQCGRTSTDLAYALGADSDVANDLAFAALSPNAVLVSGRAVGKVENIMYALGGAHTQAGLALFAGAMCDGIADCGVLQTLESDEGDDETGCRFLGYKFVVKRSAASSAKLMCHRDLVYLEYTGYTQSSSGERLGFHIEHSVDVPGFPDLHSRNSSRALQSVRYIFRQKSEGVMEIYMLGNLELAGVLNVGGVGVGGASGAGGGDIFSISRLQQCAETRRLTLMVRRRRESIDILQASSSHHSTECSLCHRSKRFFSGSLLAECDVCGQLVCSKCRNDKKMFVRDGLLGKFQRAQTCKTCALAARAGFAAPTMHLSVSLQVDRNQGPDKAGGLRSGSMCGRRYSRSYESRSLSIGGHSDVPSASGNSCRHGAVYTFAELDEEGVNRSRHHQLRQPTSHRKKLQSATIDPVNSQQPEEGTNRGGPGPFSIPKRAPRPPTAPPLSTSTSKSRGRSGTSSSNSSASSDSLNSGRAHRRGIYLTPQDPSQLHEQEQHQSQEIGRQHRLQHCQQLELQEHRRRQKQTHRSADQLVVQNNYQITSHDNTLVAYCANYQRQLARTTLDPPVRGLVNPYSSSSSDSSSTNSLAAMANSVQFSRSVRGDQRSLSIPMPAGKSRQIDLVTQMMELNMKAEHTYNATQRNGAFLKSQVRAGRW